MLKISLCVWKGDREKLLDRLRQAGTVQIREMPEDTPGVHRTDTAALAGAWDKKRRKCAEALAVLDKVCPKKMGFLDFLKGKTEISPGTYRRLAGKETEIYETAERILSSYKKLENIKAESLGLEKSLESLEPWTALDLPPDTKGTKRTSVLLGSLPGDWDREQIIRKLGAAGEQAEIEILGRGQGGTRLALLFLRNQEQEIRRTLGEARFAPAGLKFHETPEEHVRKLKAQRQMLEEEEKTLLELIKRGAGQRAKLCFLEDFCRGQEEKYRVLGELLQTSHAVFLSGCTPAKEGKKLCGELEKTFCCAAELEEIPEEEERPVLLENGSFSSPVEAVVESYGLPGRGEVDPTRIMAFFYYFFFGLMLSDAGYGLVMTAVSGLILKKFPKMEEKTRRTLKMFLYCGISSTVWGVLFGGYFGDVIPVVSETFFNRKVTVPALWFVPLRDPMKLLMFSFLFGLIHLFAGLAVKGFLLLREKRYFDCLCEVGFWYMLLTGLVLMLLPSRMFAMAAGTDFHFPGWMTQLSKALAGTGAAGILLLAGRRKKNFGLRLALGIYELYGAAGWLSDVLSYARLLALGIATGVIASVINTMGAMTGDGILGGIAFALIFLTGHTMNLAINLLGAYVHTNRLQYVEFFGKFYQGQGKAFRPFSEDTNRYIKVKEEQ